MKKIFTGLLCGMIGAAAGAVGMGILKNKDIKNGINIIDRYRGYYNILNQWVTLKNDGKRLEQYFIDNNIKSIAIYGMGELGCRLYEELKNSSIEIKYAIDKNASDLYCELGVISTDDEFEEVDIIVVSVFHAFDQIKEELQDKIDIDIISLEEVILAI